MVDDEHFLGRLSRLEASEVSDALALYYAPELVRELLSYARERGHTDRVAISIDDPVEGPFIIVSQNGHFVTALARGMEPTDVPIVPRSVWDARRRESERFREAWAVASASSHARMNEAARDLRTKGPNMSREAMGVLTALSRLTLEQTFLRAWVAHQETLLVAGQKLESRATWKMLDDGIMADAERVLWVIGHLSVIVGGGDFKKRIDTDPVIGALRTLRPSYAAAEVGLLGPLARNLWAVGKLGPLYFKLLKDGFREAPDPVFELDAALGLTAIGLRFSKYRGEIRKLLTIAEQPDETPAERRRRNMGKLAAMALDKEDPREAARATVEVLGRRMWFENNKTAPLGHPCRFASPEDVPPEVSLPTIANGPDDIWEGEILGPAAAVFIPGVCALEAEELYYPAAYARYIEPYVFGPRLETAYRRMRARLAPTPVRSSAPKPGRNDPCPCGSGRKYKRCCLS